MGCDPRILAVFLLSVFGALACGKVEPVCDLTRTFCSCDVSATSGSASGCFDYEGQSTDTARSDCKGRAGTLSNAAGCPTASRVGTCRITAGTAKIHMRYYSDAVAGEVACSLLNMGTSFTGTVVWVPN